MRLTGGCFCGAIRYCSTAPSLDAGYCHCTVCQKICGSPTVVWLSVPKAGFAFTQGTPVEFASSQQGRRYFCGVCGTPLMFTQANGDEVDLTLTTLDDDRAIALDYHIWTAHQKPWLHLADDLPRYLDNGPDR